MSRSSWRRLSAWQLSMKVLFQVKVDRGSCDCPSRRLSRFRDDDAFQDVHLGADVTLGLVVPPALVIDQQHAHPAVQGLVEPVVARTLVRPVQQLDQLVPGKVDLHVLEVVSELGEVDQGDDHVGVERRRQAVGIAAGDGQPSVAAFEGEGLLPLGRESASRAIGNSARFISSRPIREAGSKFACRSSWEVSVAMSSRFHEKSIKATTSFGRSVRIVGRRRLLQVYKVNKVVRLAIKKARIS